MKRFIFVCSVLLLALLNPFTAAADEEITAECILRIDGEQTEVLRPGTASAELVFDSGYSRTAVLWLAAYENDILTGVSSINVNIVKGENILFSENLQISGNVSEVKAMLIETVNFIPLTQSTSYLSEEYMPRIKQLSAVMDSTDKNGKKCKKTYDGLIDDNEKRVYINVPVSVNSDGTKQNAKLKGGEYVSAPSPEEFEKSVTNVTLNIEASPKTKVISQTSGVDLSGEYKIVLENDRGVKEEYTLTALPYTVQRDIGFTGKINLVTPDSAYGNNVSRHGAPGPDGTIAGGGIWTLSGFEYQKEDDGSYTKNFDKSDDRTGFVRTDDTSGFIDTSGAGYLRFIKDREGEFSLCSSAGAAEKSLISETDSSISVNVGKISDGGNVDICFGENRFIMRLVKNSSSDSLRVWFGFESVSDGNTVFEGEDSGTDILLKEDYTFRCLTSVNDDGTVSGSLFINGACVINLKAQFDKFYNLNASHVRIKAGSETLCSIKIYSWRLWYIKNDPQKIRDIYDSVAAEERDIWRWIATLYDGEGTISYDTGIDTEHLKYDSMNYISGGTGNGFFYSPGSKANSDSFCAEIESTGQVLSSMSQVGLLKYMPQNIRDRFYLYAASRYKSGADAGFGAGYYDTLYADKVNSRGHSRNQSNAAGIIGFTSSDAVNRYKTSTIAVTGDSADPNDSAMPGTMLQSNAMMLSSSSEQWTDLTRQGEANAGNMTAAIKAGPKAYRNWIENLCWNTNSWTAGDLLSNTPLYIEEYAEGDSQKEYYHEALEYLALNQNDDGTWWKPGGRDKAFGTEVSGMYKICLFLNHVPAEVLDNDSVWTGLGLNSENKMPKAQEIYDYIMYNMRNYNSIMAENPNYYGMTNTLMMRNTLDVIYSIKNQINQSLFENDLPFIIEFAYNFMRKFKLNAGEYTSQIKYNADGSIAERTSPANTGMGYNQALGISEGCINTCTSITKLYAYFKEFYGISRPVFDKEFASEFYAILADEINNGTWKNTYENSYGIKHQYVSESFADCGEWTPDSGTMPGGAVMQYNKRESSKLFLETDKKLNRRMLRFTFDRTSESSGASLTIKTPVMDNVRIKQAVLEFEIKVDSGASNNAGNILFFGLSNAAQFSLKSSGNNLNIVTRTASNKIGTKAYKSLNPEVLYKIRMVYTPDEAEKITLSVNDEKVYAGNDYCGAPSGSAPMYIGGFNLTFYKNTTASVSLDNIKIETET